MPGGVVDFWIWKKEKAAGKAALVCELSFICYISALNTLLGTF